MKKTDFNHSPLTSKKINMKQYILILVMLLGTAGLWAQNKSDQAAVLQKCISLPSVAKHFKSDPTGVPISLYVVQGSVIIPADLDVSYFGKKVIFGTQSEIAGKNADSFFSFTRFDVSQSSAIVSFDYSYNSGNNLIHLSLEFQNNGGQWNISDTKETTR